MLGCVVHVKLRMLCCAWSDVVRCYMTATIYGHAKTDIVWLLCASSTRRWVALSFKHITASVYLLAVSSLVHDADAA